MEGKFGRCEVEAAVKLTLYLGLSVCTRHVMTMRARTRRRLRSDREEIRRGRGRHPGGATVRGGVAELELHLLLRSNA